jgi:lipopolysaccharide export system permease protein
MILFRYLAREVIRNFLLISIILYVVLLSNLLIRYLNQMAIGHLAVDLLWKLILLESPRFLSGLLPFCLLLAILLSYARLYSDHEMTVLSACGFSLLNLLKLTLPVTVGVMLLVGLLSTWVSPKLFAYRNKLLTQTGTAVELQTIQPGRFQQFENGRRIIYIENISPDHTRVKNIFMARMRDAQPGLNANPPWILMTARNGYQTVNLKTGEQFFTVQEGQRYEGDPGAYLFTRARFGSFTLRIDAQNAPHVSDTETFPLNALLHADPKNYALYSELQWRFASPISALLLTLIAIPLSQVNPRKGKYLSILGGIIIYVIYMNLLLLGRDWIENGTALAHWGLWWIHGLLGILALGIWIYKRYGSVIRARLSL